MKKFILFVMLCIPVALVAQTPNGVKVSGLEVNSGTVTFDVSWNKATMPEVWSDSAWVFVDYNKNGVMTRLPLSTGATLTETSAPDVGKVIEVENNNQGVWVVGNAKKSGAGSFSATVKLLTATANLAGACAYASNYPPVGKYVLPNVVEFTGTAPYTVMLKGNPNPQTAGSNYEVSGTIASFTDKTGAPGRLNCIPMTGNIDFSTSETVAKGQPVSFAVITNPTVPPAESITYTWSAFNSNGLGGPSYMPTAPVITGAYTVTLTARSEGYCDLTKSKKVEVIDCFPSSTYDLVASAPGFCAGDAGVTFSLSRTEYGRSYELYKGATTVTTLIGTGSAATFSGAQTEGIYTARVLASADGYCEAEMSGSPTISRNSLPTAPTISQPVDVCFNGGSIVFTATGYTGSLTWVSTGGGSESGNSVTFASGAATGTKAVTARSAQTYTNNAPTCYSAEVTQLASVLALPATPTLAVSASTVCLGTNIVFRVTVPESGATYTWSGAEGTASGIGDGTYTVSSATTSTVSVTAHARKLVNETTCQSGNASLSAVVSQPSAVGQEQHPVCGCASPGIPCSGQCRTSCGPDFTSDCQSNQWNPELFSPSIVDCYNACVAYAATYRYYYYVTLNPGSLGARCTCYRCN